jgi:acetyl esterase/lipase
MIRKRIPLWKREEYNFPGAGEFIPFLMASLHDDDEVRPAMIVAPGGGFIILSPGEAEGVAKRFFDMGYNTFVLVYTNNVTLDKPMIHQALRDASRAVQIIRKNSAELHVHPNKIAGCGFSGGGYMIGSLAVLHELPYLHTDDEYSGVSNRLDAAILNYALITGGNYTAPGLGYSTLLGPDATQEEIDAYSLELQVNENTVPMFLVHGTADDLVPVQNADLLAHACSDHNIPHEVHIFLGCPHGFSVAGLPTEGALSSLYVYEQLYHTINAMSDDEFAGYAHLLSPLRKNMEYDEFAQVVFKEVMGKLWFTGLKIDLDAVMEKMKSGMAEDDYRSKINKSASLWWEMAQNWLDMVFE